MARGCLKSIACSVRAYPRLSDCLDGFNNLHRKTGLAPVYRGIYRCVTNAGNCDGVRACHGVGPTCDSSFQASCDDGVALFCDLLDHTSFRLSCRVHGLSCRVQSVAGRSFNATCVGGDDDAPRAEVDCGGGLCERTGEACTPGTEFDRCDNGRLLACVGGEWIAFDCARLGLAPCQPDPLGAACGGV